MRLKKLLNMVYWLFLLFLVSIAVALNLAKFNTPLGFRLFSVQSASMGPNIALGSLVVVQRQDTYEKGEIITFASEYDPKETVTHRIVEVISDGALSKLEYQVKGDVNEDPDPEPVSSSRVIGKVVKVVPKLGFVVAFAQTQLGLIILVIIPATLIVYSELLGIKKEVLLLIKKRKERKKDKKK